MRRRSPATLSSRRKLRNAALEAARQFADRPLSDPEDGGGDHPRTVIAPDPIHQTPAPGNSQPGVGMPVHGSLRPHAGSYALNINRLLAHHEALRKDRNNMYGDHT